MSKKYLICLLLVIVVISAISQVNATELNGTEEIIFTDDCDEVLSTIYAPKDFNELENSIESANDGDTIELNGTYYFPKTITVDKSLNIVGSDNTVVQQDEFNIHKIRLFEIKASNVVLNNLNIIGGQNQDGGAIYWSGDNATVMNCLFKSNMAVNGGEGGAIMVVGNNFNIQNSTFTNNRVTKGAGGVLSIHGDGAVIDNCTFDSNMVDDGYAGAVALFANNGRIENCIFTNNYCTEFGGAVVLYNKSNKIISSIFKNNQVKNNLSNFSGGGAIFSDCDNLMVENCTFSNNNAKMAYGGAIYSLKNSIVINSSFKDNEAMLGNAIYASHATLISNYFALKYNETQKENVHADELTEFNNTFEEIKEDSSVTFIASMVFEYASSGSIHVTVEGGRIDLENISVIGQPKAKISFNDNVLVVSGLNVGNYTLRVVTTPDEAHNSVESFLPITVNKATAVIKATKTTVALKKGTLWSIKIINSQTKKPIAKMKLTLKVYTGKKYKTVYVTTNSKGEATYQTKNLAKGNHKVVVSANHDGYNFNTLYSSINVIKPVKLIYKVKKKTNTQGTLLSITVYKKSTKKPINGVKLKLLVYTGKKYKTVILKSKTIKGNKGVCGYGTNAFSVGNHKVVIMPAEIKYDGSAKSSIKITKANKKVPIWTKIR